MKLTSLLLIICVLAAGYFVGCTDNARAKHWGGHYTETLPANHKLVTVDWDKESHLWILTRPMRPGEVAETYSLKEKSNFGILQGEVTIVEVK